MGKEFLKSNPLNSSENIEDKRKTTEKDKEKEKKFLDSQVSDALGKSTVWEEPFAEVRLDDEWVKVEILTREVLTEGTYLVERLDRFGPPFEVKAQELTSFGSHEPETKWETWKREEFEKLEELLKKENCTIERVKEDGNCLFRAVARQIYGDQEQYQKVREETVDYVINHRRYFTEFETDIDERLSKQLMNHSWGGNLEIAAISKLYDVGILVRELSQSGQLVAPFDNSKLAAAKGRPILYLVRHRKKTF